MGNQFVAGLADDSKLDMVQLYLQDQPITIPPVKTAVIKAYSRIGRASLFNKRAVSSSKQDEVSQNEVNLELMNFFKGLHYLLGTHILSIKSGKHERTGSNVGNQ